MVNDEWDVWGDIAPSAFDAANNASALIGAPSLGASGRSWPDLDMLPQGFIGSAAADDGPTHFSNLTRDEQATQTILWAMARSPLFFGGDLRQSNRSSLSLLKHVEVLGLSCCSHGNRQAVATQRTRVWRASSADNSTIYVALFNVVGEKPIEVSATLAELAIPSSWTARSMSVRDVLSNVTVKSLKPGATSLSFPVNRHGTRLVAVTQGSSTPNGR